MAVKLGEKILKDIYLGDKRIVKAYFGNKLVFEADKPIFVEWIESTGTQWIDTEYIMTSDNQEVEIEFQYTDSTSTQCLCGTLPGANRGITPYTSNDGYFFVHTGQPAILKFSNFDYSAKHSLYVKAVVGQGVYGKLDNIEQTTTTVLTTINKSNPYFLFCRNNGVNNKPDTSYFKGRISKYKMKDNGVVVRDFRPCVHPKTFEACMYDLVTHKYFYNKGTGSFIPAPRFVEYLESDSTAYIDTGISGGNDNLSLNMTFYVDKHFTYGAIFGNYVDENTNTFRVICSENANRLYFNANTRCSYVSFYGIDGNFYGSKHTLKLEKTKLTIDGVSADVTKYIGTENNTNIALFNRSIANPIDANNIRDIGLRIYNCQMNDGDVMIRDFRPCLRGNTPCMYDMVTGTYLYNKGTGEFKYGRLV